MIGRPKTFHTVVAVSILSVTFSFLNLPSAQAQIATSCDDNEQMYDEIWTLIDRHFLYRDRLKNWNNWRHKFDGRMATKQAGQDAINNMLDSLDDEYTFFRDQSATEERKNLRLKPQVVEHRMLEGNIGYLKITTFNSLYCVPETRQALSELSSANALVLDLRDNWGGSITTTYDVFSLLSNSGKFVSMRGTTNKADYVEEMFLSADSSITITDGVAVATPREFNISGGKPLAVLVNENTKSAAEMLAGALKDNGRATVIGCRTYGKGIVQRVWEFPNNTSIKISSARFFLPGGANIHRIGVVPDLIVTIPTASRQRTMALTLAKRQKPPSALKAVSKTSSTISIDLKRDNKIAHHGLLSADLQSPDINSGKDRQLCEAQLVLKRKLVSLAKP